LLEQHAPQLFGFRFEHIDALDERLQRPHCARRPARSSSDITSSATETCAKPRDV
jgi:hypothetical protein